MSKFPEHIVETLRERLGLEPDDDSRDAHIEHYDGEKAADEVFAWHIGCGEGGAGFAIRVLRACGFQVVPPSEEER